MTRDAYGKYSRNNYQRWWPIRNDAPEEPWAMFLASRDGYYRALCFDFDGKDSESVKPELVEQAQDQCDALSALLTDHGITHLVCQSSISGSRHIWVNVRAGADADAVKALGKAASLNFSRLDHGMLCNPVTGMARPPLSPHRDGSSSTVLRGDVEQFLAQPTPSEALPALTTVLAARRPTLRQEDSPPSGPVLATHRVHRALSDAGQAHMATIGGGPDVSWTGYMCLLAAANAGWSFADAERASHTAPGMEHYRTKNNGDGTRSPRNPRERLDRLTKQWNLAVTRTSVQRVLPASQEPKDLTELERIVSDAGTVLHMIRRSPGRWRASESAVNDSTVLAALAYYTLHTGKRVVAASVRTLSNLTGISDSTVAVALQRLARAGYATRMTAAEGLHAAEWALTVRSNAPLDDFSTAYGTVRTQLSPIAAPPTDIYTDRALLVEELTQLLLEQRHDLFTRAGIGHRAGRLWTELRHHTALSVPRAAALLGVTERHAVTVLSRLRAVKLIVKHRDGWARSKKDLRNHAARTLGVAGYLATRALRHLYERQAWDWWRAEYEVMTMPPQQRPRRVHVTERALYEEFRPGRRSWPRFPRRSDGRANWPEALRLIAAGALNPDARWKYVG